MKFNRRNFLRSASLLAAFSLNDIDAMAKMSMPSKGGGELHTDEKYWTDIRTLFPLKKSRAYLNNGTLGPSPYPVIEATHKGMMHSDELGEYHKDKKLRESIARFIGASSEEVAFTHNVTEGINISCWGMPLKRRDEVLMTTHEHVGNALPWLNRARRDGIVIKTLELGKTAAETLQNFEAALTKRTRVIAVPHIPCTVGQILPVKEMCALARRKGIYSFVDGAHGPGMLPIDVKEIGCDVYASCAHKWLLGPKGTGFLYVGDHFWDVLQPLFVGGGSSNFHLVKEDYVMDAYVNNAHRYYGGTQSTGLIDGVVAAVDFMEQIGVENVYRRVKYLGSYAQEQLHSLGSKVAILTPQEEQSFCGINSFKIVDRDNKDIYNKILKKGVRLRYVPESDLYCIRVSTHIYNNKAEIDKLIGLLKASL